MTYVFQVTNLNDDFLRKVSFQGAKDMLSGDERIQLSVRYAVF
jgi:hypothetical protein